MQALFYFSNTRIICWVIIFFFSSTWATLAQQPAAFRCGTANFTPNRLAVLGRLSRTPQARSQAGTVSYVPLRLHIVRRADGSGGANEAVLYQSIAETNRLFGPGDLQLFVCGSPDYINSDALYNATGTSWSALDNLPGYSNAQLNVYYVNSLTINNYSYGGAAYINSTGTQRSALIVDNLARVLAHEVGHLFGLPHTFNNNDSANPTERELVARTNCTTAGDGFCDTAADPFGLPGATTSNCTYTGSIVDAQGARYAPDMHNNMSYWGCGTQYTPEQYARMQAVSQTSYSNLNCSQASPAAPTALTVIGGGCLGQPQLTWRNNATTPVALGYFIERAAGSGSFTAVAAVGAGVNSFQDYSAPGNATVEYRVKPINAANAYSNAISITTARTYCPATYSAATTCASPTGAAGLGTITVRQGTSTVFAWNTPGCGPPYSAFPGQAVRLLPGTTYSLEVRLFTFGQGVVYLQHVSAWLDYNQNGSFTDAGELLLQSTPATQQQAVFTSTFTVPAGVSSGCGVLRVRTQSAGSGIITDPCAQLSWGETQDRPVLFGTVTATTTLTAGPTFALLPNPAAGRVIVKLGNALLAPNSLVLLDATGREARQLSLPSGATEATLTLTGLQPGLYLVRVGATTARLLVE